MDTKALGIEPCRPQGVRVRSLAFLKPKNWSFACESFSQGMVGTINVNSDNAVWTSNEYKDLIRSSSDEEFQTQYLNFGML